MTPSFPDVTLVVVDTDVASFVVNDDPIRSARYLPHLRNRTLVLPFSCVAELEYGARKRNWGPRRFKQLDDFIQGCRIVTADRDLCAAWADLRLAVQRQGRIIERQDAWVAAVALHLEAPLVTHNRKHFEPVPLLQVISESD